jgi:hypothetical protein
MFGKNDALVDNSYTHTASPQAAQESEFGAAGGDFMTAPTPQAPASITPVQPLQEAPAQPETYAPQPEAPQAAPAAEAAPQSAAVSSDGRTTTMSFSEMMARRGQQQAPAAEAPAPQAPLAEAPVAEAAPEAAAYDELPEAPAMDAAPAPSYQTDTQSAPAFAPPPVEAEPFEQAVEEQPAMDEAPQMDAEGVEQYEAYAAEADQQELAAMQGLVDEMQAEQGGLSAEQNGALQQVADSLNHEDVSRANGKTRVQAAALKVLVQKAQSQDENALAQLSTHGFELLEKISEGLPSRSEALDQLVEGVGALVGADLIVAADSKAQQTDALLAVAHGVGMQGQVAAIQHNQEMEQQGFAQREAEKKAARQEGLPTGQYL